MPESDNSRPLEDDSGWKTTPLRSVELRRGRQVMLKWSDAKQVFCSVLSPQSSVLFCLTSVFCLLSSVLCLLSSVLFLLSPDICSLSSVFS